MKSSGLAACFQQISVLAVISTCWAMTLNCEGQGKADLRVKGDKAVSFELTSAAFTHGASIPVKHTGDGPDVSPALTWTDPPVGTKSFVLICDDPDAPAGTWVHWVMYDIPVDARRMEENVSKKETVLGTAKQGQNDFRRIGYDGPAPPPGKPHRYVFKLYAVDIETGLAPGATKKQALKAIKGHLLADAELMGTYQR